MLRVHMEHLDHRSIALINTGHASQAQTMLYSKRLTSLFAHVVFVAFVLFVVAFGLPGWVNHLPIFPILLGLMVVFILVGTAGWHYVGEWQRSRVYKIADMSGILGESAFVELSAIPGKNKELERSP
jgi:hypothetical protein